MQFSFRSGDFVYSVVLKLRDALCVDAVHARVVAAGSERSEVDEI